MFDGATPGVPPFLATSHGAGIWLRDSGDGSILRVLDDGPEPHADDLYEVVELAVAPGSTPSEGAVAYTAFIGDHREQVRLLTWGPDWTVTDVLFDGEEKVNGDEPSGLAFGPQAELLALRGHELLRFGLRDDHGASPIDQITIEGLPDETVDGDQVRYRLEDFVSTTVSDGTGSMLLTSSDMRAYRVTLADYGMTPLSAEPAVPFESDPGAIVDLGFLNNRPDRIVQLLAETTDHGVVTCTLQRMYGSGAVLDEVEMPTQTVDRASISTAGDGIARRDHTTRVLHVIDASADAGRDLYEVEDVSAFAWGR